jgi:hypothetical protein
MVYQREVIYLLQKKKEVTLLDLTINFSCNIMLFANKIKTFQRHFEYKSIYVSFMS